MDLWQYIPGWMINILHAKNCSECQCPVKKTDILALGIRKIEDSDKLTLVVEHACQQCKKRVMTSFSREKQGSVEDFCYLLIEHMHKQKEIETSQKITHLPNQEAISDKEVKELLDFMYHSKSHEDFMKFIDASKFSDGLD